MEGSLPGQGRLGEMDHNSRNLIETKAVWLALLSFQDFLEEKTWYTHRQYNYQGTYESPEQQKSSSTLPGGHADSILG